MDVYVRGSWQPLLKFDVSNRYNIYKKEVVFNSGVKKSKHKETKGLFDKRVRGCYIKVGWDENSVETRKMNKVKSAIWKEDEWSLLY